MYLGHDAALTIATSIAAVVAGVVTWCACHWWYGRRLVAAAQRLEKNDKARQFAQEQTLQARRQVEQLKTELEAQQRSASHDQATARQLAARLEAERQAAERELARDSGFVPIVAGHGFADTQILPE